MSTMRLAGATGDAVAVVEGLPGASRVHLGLDGSGAQCVAVDPRAPDRMVAGTFDRGIFLTGDAGRTWRDISAGIPHARVLSVAFSPCESSQSRSVVYAGTEPSSVYRSDDDGRTWKDLAALRDLPSAPTWSFPPRPWTHHVRWIAPHQTRPEVLFVGIELGGVLRTLDGGSTWDDRHPDAVIDPHVLRTHAVATDRVYGVGGDGIAYSLDAGESWRRDVDGMDRQYTWGLAVDTEDPDLWYASASTGPMQAHGEGDAQARLYRKVGPSAWEPLRLDGHDGVDAPLQTMPYALVTPRELAGYIVVGMRDGTLLIGREAGDSWQTLDAKLPGILALADATA